MMSLLSLQLQGKLKLASHDCGSQCTKGKLMRFGNTKLETQYNVLDSYMHVSTLYYVQVP